MNDCVCLLQIANGWAFFFVPPHNFRCVSDVINHNGWICLCWDPMAGGMFTNENSIILFQLGGFWVGHLCHPIIESTKACPISIRTQNTQTKPNKCRNEIRLNSSRILNLLSKFSVSKPQFETLFLWPYSVDKKKIRLSSHYINTYFKLNYIQCGFHGILLGIWNLTIH